MFDIQMKRAIDQDLFKAHVQTSVYDLYSSQVVLVFSKLIVSIDMCLLMLYLSLLSSLSIYFNSN